MSNFQTTEEEYRQYAKLATSAESLIYSDPKSSVAVFGNFSEQLTREIMHLEGFGDWNLKQIDRINELKSRGDYPPIVTKYLDDICILAYYSFDREPSFMGNINVLRDIVGLKHIITTKASSIHT